MVNTQKISSCYVVEQWVPSTRSWTLLMHAHGNLEKAQKFAAVYEEETSKRTRIVRMTKDLVL